MSDIDVLFEEAMGALKRREEGCAHSRVLKKFNRIVRGTAYTPASLALLVDRLCEKGVPDGMALAQGDKRIETEEECLDFLIEGRMPRG